MYVTGCGEDVHSYQVAKGVPPTPGSNEEYMVTVGFIAPSVEAWIERKLAGGSMADASFLPKHELTPEMVDDVGLT